MFRVKKDRTVKWPVTITAARNDGSGKVDKFKFHITVRTLKRSDSVDISQRLTPETAIEVENELFDRIIDWHDIGNEDGDELPFSKDALAELLDEYPNAAGALVNAIRDATAGVEAKN